MKTASSMMSLARTWKLLLVAVATLGVQFANCFAEGMRFRSDSAGNVFVSATGSITLEIDNPNAIASGEVDVIDEYGGRVHSISLKQGDSSLNIPLGKGYYEVNAHVKFKSGVTLVQSTHAAVIGVEISKEVRQQSRFGFFGAEGSPVQAIRAGGRWNRTFFHVKGYADTKEGFKWIYPWKESALTEDQTWVKQLTVIPAWLRGGAGEVTNKDMYPPQDWGKFAELIKWAVLNDPAQSRFIEILNEPEWNWKASNEELVRYFNVTAKAIHEVNSRIKVLGPTLSTINLEKFKALVQLGVLDNLDGIAMHAYVNGTAPEAEFIRRIIDMGDYLRSIGKDHLPIYLTEFGWTTGKGTWPKAVDELTQARYISRALVLLSTQRIDAIMPFCLKYNAPIPSEAGFSILRQDDTPKPAYAAYANTVRWLSGVDGLGTWMQIPPALNLVSFERKGKKFVVLWSAIGRVSVSLQPCRVFRVEDMVGRGVPLHGGCSIEVGETPLFIEGDGLETTQFKRITN